MSEPLVQIVDEQDQPVGGATKQEAFARGLVRRVVRGMTEDEFGRLLLHKRAPHKVPYPNLWDWLPSGHVDEDETYDQAMHREAEEELGIPSSMITLSAIETYYSSVTANGIKSSSFSRVYKVTLTAKAPIRLDESEATELRWFTIKELAEALAQSPDHFAPGVQRLFPKYYQV